jgi:competence protein ComGC
MGKISKFNPPQIGQELLTDPRVSLSAKGLYAFLQVFDTDGELDFAFMCKAYNIDKQEFDDSLDELISHGYVSIESQYGVLVYVLNGI